MENSPDISCSSDPLNCNNATWADPGVDGRALPGMIDSSPPVKDTILIPAGGYVVIRLKADNPGKYRLCKAKRPYHITSKQILPLTLTSDYEIPELK